MSDEGSCLDLISALTIIAGAFALYYKFRYASGSRRIAALIEEQKARESEKAASPEEPSVGDDHKVS